MSFHNLMNESTSSALVELPWQSPARPLGQRVDQEANQRLVDALVAERVVARTVAAVLLPRSQIASAPPLIQLLADEQVASREEILLAVVRRSGLSYVPLAQYTVCDQVVRLLPAGFCARHHVVPFDRLSRAVLMATANPFDERTRQEVERRLQRRVFWSVTDPADITALLARVHGPLSQLEAV